MLFPWRKPDFRLHRSASANAEFNSDTNERKQKMQTNDRPGPQIEIFTGTHCGYCHRAKALLARRNLPFREIDVSAVEGRAEMLRRLPSARTVPQIFIGGKHVGGCEDLERLDADGALSALVA